MDTALLPLTLLVSGVTASLLPPFGMFVPPPNCTRPSTTTLVCPLCTVCCYRNHGGAPTPSGKPFRIARHSDHATRRLPAEVQGRQLSPYSPRKAPPRYHISASAVFIMHLQLIDTKLVPQTREEISNKAPSNEAKTIHSSTRSLDTRTGTIKRTATPTWSEKRRKRWSSASRPDGCHKI